MIYLNIYTQRHKMIYIYIYVYIYIDIIKAIFDIVQSLPGKPSFFVFVFSRVGVLRSPSSGEVDKSTACTSVDMRCHWNDPGSVDC